MSSDFHFLCFFSVIVLAVRGETLRALMIHAYNLGLIEQNYMFICVYYYSQRNTFGDISWKQVPLFYRKVQSVSNRMVALQLQCIFQILPSIIEVLQSNLRTYCTKIQHTFLSLTNYCIFVFLKEIVFQNNLNLPILFPYLNLYPSCSTNREQLHFMSDP